MTNILKKSIIYRELKKSNISGRNLEKSTFDYVDCELSEKLPKDCFSLVDYECTQNYRFSLMHDVHSSFSNVYLGNTPLCTYEFNEMDEFLKRLFEPSLDQVIWIISEYPKKIPSVITTIRTFMDNKELFMKLMEDDFLIVNEGGHLVMGINSESRNLTETVTIKTIKKGHS
ncbi:hypothetical protein [Thalassomonas actiniarum]|uniref:Uncharacterized protein n=1 Tax=Thalassomonas actiniarum TaxID=485447 RepID=A0AAE9YMZ5_9GAMM|nr:hypothetical protein [Thalassomonas actiniarum]WDD97737.1 hypothetical protein SG35_020900 [Thalassomonas actiniarum]